MARVLANENGERRSTENMSLRMITKPLNSIWKIG